MKWSFEEFKPEREDIRQDLQGLELSLSGGRIGDFACGWGKTSLGLMLELPCRECIGVDRFEKNLVLDVPSIQDVQEQFEEIKSIVLSSSNPLQEDRAITELRPLIENERLPKFQIGDIVAGENLPSELDFVYCKKLLQNIPGGAYSNRHQGDDGIKLAIKQIASSVKRGGHICLVEPAGINFMLYLEQEGLDLIRCCRIQRNEIIGQKRDTLYKAQYLIYHYVKV